MKKQLLFLTCMAVLFGCAKENLPQRPDAAIAVGQAKSRFLTLDSIQQLAAELPECFGEGALTRSGYTKSVAALFPLSDILRSSATNREKQTTQKSLKIFTWSITPTTEASRFLPPTP